MNAVGLLLVPKLVVTEMGAFVAPNGTKAVICVPVSLTLKPAAGLPPNLTAVAPVKCAPWMMTV